MRYWLLVAISSVLMTNVASAQAKIVFAAYEGPDNIQTGVGGTKIAKHGVDYWTSGTPPRRYKVIGRISDRRSVEWDGGHAVGSPSVAKKVKAAGGDAVILLDQADIGTGGAGVGSFSGGIGSFLMMGSSKTTTSFAVVKYLDSVQ